MSDKIIASAGVVAFILLIPYVMDAPWSWFDYVIAGILLLGTILTLVFVTSRFKNSKKKIVAGAGVLAVAVYVWAELAVGIFTNLGS